MMIMPLRMLQLILQKSAPIIVTHVDTTQLTFPKMRKRRRISVISKSHPWQNVPARSSLANTKLEISQRRTLLKLRLKRKQSEKQRKSVSLRKLRWLAKRLKNWHELPTSPRSTLQKKRHNGPLKSKSSNSSSHLLS